MFEKVKSILNTNDYLAEAGIIMSELVEGAPIEDSFMDSIAIPTDEEARIEELLDKIPDDDFVSDDEPIKEGDLKDEIEKQPEPTINELLDEI